MKLTKIGTFKIPSYAVCYLEYGENGGDLSDDDEQAINEFIATDCAGFDCLVFDWAGESEFTHYPAFGLPCDVTECTIYGHKIRAAKRI